MKKKIFIGMDISKKKAVWQCENQLGQCLGKGTASRKKDSIGNIERLLRELGYKPGEALVVMEATGHYHLCWAESLTALGCTVLVVNPLVAKRVYTVGNAIRDHKTDPVDAAALCQLGREKGSELQSFAYHSDARRFGLQKLRSVRKAIRKSLTNSKKAAGELLDFVFPELHAPGLGLAQKSVRKMLRKAPCAAAVAALAPEQLESVFGASKAETLRQAALRSFAPSAPAAEGSVALLRFLDLIELLEGQMKGIQERIETSFLKAVDPAWIALARSVSGFGAVTIPAILAFIPRGFEKWGSKKKTTAKLQALFGMDPRLRRSGQWKGKEKIPNAGSKSPAPPYPGPPSAPLPATPKTRLITKRSGQGASVTMLLSSTSCASNFAASFRSSKISKCLFRTPSPLKENAIIFT